MTPRNLSTHALALLAAALLAATTAGHAHAANVAANTPDAVSDAAAAVPGSAAASPDATAALPDSAAEPSAAHEPIATAALPEPDPSASARPGAVTPRTTALALVTATVPAAHAPAPAAAGTSAIRQSDPSAKADPPATSPSAPDSATTTAEVSDEFAVSAAAAHQLAANAVPADQSASASVTSRAAAATGSAAAPVPAAAAPVTAVPAEAPAPPATAALPDATASSAPATATPPAAGSPASPAAAPTPVAVSPVTPPTPPADAESLARAYRRTGAAPTVEITDQGCGAVSLVPFGHGKPILRCAPLRACAVELEPGELILSTSLGDGERWLVQSAAAGPGARTPLLVVKPTACDLSTNLVVATDRRIYELALDSPPCHNADLGAGGAGGAAGAAGEGAYNPRLPYTGLVRFYYPDDLVRRWTDQEALAREQDAAEAAGRTPLAPAARLAHLNFDYSWDRSRRWPWVPSQVFDDGEHTYLVLPPAARLAELPILLAVEPGGALALLTYHLEDQTLVADRVLDHAVLLVGHGRPKDEQRLEIVNRAFPAAASQAIRNAQTRRPAEAGH